MLHQLQRRFSLALTCTGLCAGLVIAGCSKDAPTEPTPPDNGGNDTTSEARVDDNGVPILTAWNLPKANEHWYCALAETGTVDVGQAGAGRTWDFSWLVSTGKYIVTHYAPEHTPIANQFPTATMAEGDNNSSILIYYRQEPKAYLDLGLYQGSNGFLMRYSKIDTAYRLPLPYGTVTVSAGYGVFKNGFNDLRRIAPGTTSADAWGKLTTPAGTFEKTLRIRSARVITDSTYSSDGTFNNVTTTESDMYTWYAAGRRFPVLQISHIRGRVNMDLALWDTVAPKGATRRASEGSAGKIASGKPDSGKPAPGASATGTALLEKLERNGITLMPMAGRIAIAPSVREKR